MQFLKNNVCKYKTYYTIDPESYFYHHTEQSIFVVQKSVDIYISIISLMITCNRILG